MEKLRPNQVMTASKKKPNRPKTANPRQNPRAKKMHQNAVEWEIESMVARGHHGLTAVTITAVVAAMVMAALNPPRLFCFFAAFCFLTRFFIRLSCYFAFEVDNLAAKREEFHDSKLIKTPLKRSKNKKRDWAKAVG